MTPSSESSAQPVLNPTMKKKQTASLACTHCGLPVPGFRAMGKREGDIVFCCEGCRAVYQIITGCNLQEYYTLKKQAAHFAASQPASAVFARYSYLDDATIREKFAYGENVRSMDFYMEGVHCVACLWLIEKIGMVVPGVHSVRMNLGSLVAQVTLEEKGSFAAVAEGFERIGYRPHVVCEKQEAQNLNRVENRRDLLRIGIAGFCMMNIMIFFVSIYTGANAGLLALFRWLSGAIFMPAAVYCAIPFYRGAWSALRARQIHIDLPVAGAIFAGSAASYFNLITSSPHIYFDSLATFIFLLLSARYLLKTLHQKAALQTGPGEFLVPKSALAFDGETRLTRVVSVEKLRPGEKILVPQGEVIAVDGEVAEGLGYADFHMISGESQPVKLYPGAWVYAGTVNVGPDLIIIVKAVGLQTRIERLLQSVAHLEKPKTVELADFAAKRYLAAIFLGFAGLLWTCGKMSFTAGFDRALSLIIIACPCALALATPLAYRLAWRECSRAGAILKGASTLDKLADAKNLFLDKTGTLTYGKFEVLEWDIVQGSSPLAAEVYSLEKRSAHPIAFAVRDYALRLVGGQSDDVEPEKWNEILGRGVCGHLCGNFYEIRGIEDPVAAAAATVRTTVGVFRDGVLCVRIRLGDRLREDSVDATSWLFRQFETVTMITGDQKEPADAVAHQLGMKKVLAQTSPESKKAVLEKDPFSLMVGDGANDAAAMKAAAVAVAVQGSMEASFQCADVYLTVPGIGALPDLIAIARRTRQVVWVALSVSLVYNLAGMFLALLGFVTPLVAAVAMPLSSLTVLAVSYAGIQIRKRRVWK